MTTTSPSGKGFFSKFVQKSSKAALCDAPDLIPDDIFYMNFDCTKVSNKCDDVDSSKSCPLSKTKAS